MLAESQTNEMRVTFHSVAQPNLKETGLGLQFKRTSKNPQKHVIWVQRKSQECIISVRLGYVIMKCGQNEVQEDSSTGNENSIPKSRHVLLWTHSQRNLRTSQIASFAIWLLEY